MTVFDNENLNSSGLGKKRLIENLPSNPKVKILNLVKFKRTKDEGKSAYLK
jgi:hypothetical protein